MSLCHMALASTRHWWSPLEVPLKGEMGITKMVSGPLEQGHLPEVYYYLILEPKSGFSWQGMEGCCMGGQPVISSTVRTFQPLHSLYHLEQGNSSEHITRKPCFSHQLYSPLLSPSSKHTHGYRILEMCLLGFFFLLYVPPTKPQKGRKQSEILSKRLQK